MHVISKKALVEFYEKHPDSKKPLLSWYKLLKTNTFSTPNELKHAFSDVEHIGNQIHVFNIKGNHYRIICQILYNPQTVYIKGIFTHTDYDNLCKKTNLSDL